ncbi:MAG: hypothetical protein ABMB14_10870, partial [Myxococcota bacterium]
MLFWTPWVSIASAAQPFAIRAVDRATGAVAPCVHLTTIDLQEFVTDEAGLIAFDEPGLMDREVWFTVSGGGSVPADFFGYRGVTLTPRAGRTAEIEVDANAPNCEPGDAGSVAVADGFTDTPFRIVVTDAATGRGVPLIRVDVGGVPYVTDSAGNIAIREPGLLGEERSVELVAMHGYRAQDPAADVVLADGGSVALVAVREQVAERLYRLTGRGVYRDTVLLGLPTPTASPVLSGDVMGQDSILTFYDADGPVWLWGDTLRPDYPLGLFATAGAVPTPLADPADGIDLAYFVGDDGFARPMAPVPGDGPTWLTAPMTVDDGGVSRVVAVYGKFSGLTATERGLVVWDEARDVFDVDTVYPTLEPELSQQVPIARDGNLVLHERYRLPATLAAARDPSSWEVWSPIDHGLVDTWPDGETRFDWRPIGPGTLDHGTLDEDVPDADAWSGRLRDASTGDPVVIHNHSTIPSTWRGRYVEVLTENGGDSSFLGELWYAEADTPLGPWLTAVKIVTHDGYTLYNPLIHGELATDGRQLLIQGTYSTFFADASPTPLYDYNQLMFRLDLDDPRVILPTPVYDLGGGALATLPDLREDSGEPLVAFLAPDRPIDGPDGAVGLYATGPACGTRDLAVSATPPGHPRVWLVADPAPGLVPVVRAVSDADGAIGAFVDVPAGWTADAEPLGYAWPNQGPRHVPVLDWLPALRVEAGPDGCVVEDAAGAGATVALDATGSAGTDGGTVQWTLDGAVVADGPTGEVVLPVGVHHLV